MALGRATPSVVERESNIATDFVVEEFQKGERLQ